MLCVVFGGELLFKHRDQTAGAEDLCGRAVGGQRLTTDRSPGVQRADLSGLHVDFDRLALFKGIVDAGAGENRHTEIDAVAEKDSRDRFGDDELNADP